jgi:hypothetical protein
MTPRKYYWNEHIKPETEASANLSNDNKVRVIKSWI